jgi:hypothetical protein
MSKFKNVSPMGDLEVPVLGRTVKAGDTVEVPAEFADGFAAQTDVWKLVGSVPVAPVVPSGDEGVTA